MSRMKELEFEIKKLMFEMSDILETDENEDILNFLPRSDDPCLIVRLPLVLLKIVIHQKTQRKNK